MAYPHTERSPGEADIQRSDLMPEPWIGEWKLLGNLERNRVVAEEEKGREVRRKEKIKRINANISWGQPKKKPLAPPG